MPWLLLGIIAVALLWAVGRWGISTSPRNLRWSGLALLALVCLAAALFLLLRGQPGGAAAFATGALALYGRYRWIKGLVEQVAGSGRARAGSRNGARSGSATVSDEEEALAVLGLKPGADRQAVLDAHKRLMRLVHPDRGGTDYLAARVNQARDILLARLDNR